MGRYQPGESSLGRLVDQCFRLSPWALGGLALVGLGAMWAVLQPLEAAYGASGHPVDHVTGQTAFRAEIIKGYFARMQAVGDLGQYRRSQMFDYGFMLAILWTGWSLGALAARLARPGSLARRAGIAAMYCVAAGVAMDACENAVSLVMLADPAGFAGWLAVVYSGFAVLKFALLALAGLAFVMSLLLNATGRRNGRPASG